MGSSKGLLNMSIIKKERQDLLNLCEQALRKNADIQNKECHPIIKKMSHSIASRIEAIEEFCSIESYNVFFNGKIAVGKSTAICTLLGLVDNRKVNPLLPLSNLLLLKTGTGRMTVCETRILPRAEKSSIIIEPVTQSYFEACLDQFCQWLQGVQTDISQEQIRLIKNMACIPQKYRSPEDLLENYNELKEHPRIYLENKINYESRTELIYQKKDECFETWLKDTYEKINDGLLVGSPMPHRIIIKINEEDFPLNLPEYISSVVDTRGIDLGERADIQEYMSQKDSISFMCDKVNDLGSHESVMSILQQVLIKENKDTKLRVEFLCLAENGELDVITDCNTREDGMAEKKEQLRKKLRERDISFQTKNIAFYESATGFHFDNKRVSYIDSIAAKKERSGFLGEVDNLICRMYYNYRQELLSALETLSGLEYGIITDDILEKFQNSKNIVRKYEDKVLTQCNTIITKFQDSILSIYHSSLRGAVNHNGVGWTSDIYASFQKCGGQEFADNCKELKSQLLAAIDQIFINPSELGKLCFESIVQKIDELYSLYYSKARTSFYEITKQRLYNDMSWFNPKKYWGDGLGRYNARVCSDVINEVERQKIDGDLVNFQFEKCFFNEIQNFLNIV
jgi:hypothetical protein